VLLKVLVQWNSHPRLDGVSLEMLLVPSGFGAGLEMSNIDMEQVLQS
jgi:hypothetical protein